MRCWQEDAPSLGHGDGHSWEGAEALGTGHVWVKFGAYGDADAHWASLPGGDALSGGDPIGLMEVLSPRLPPQGYRLCPGAGAHCTPSPPEPACLHGGSTSPRRGPATSVYSDFNSWKEKQGPLFRHN